MIFHLWRLWRCKNVEIFKIHWKLMSFKSQYCFANISATKVLISMKFGTYIHKIVKNHQKDFRKNLCKHRRTWGVNVHARFSSRWNVRMHVYASCPRVCARIFTKNHLTNLHYLMNISLKFHKDLSFCFGDICKTILPFENHQFTMYFTYIHIFALPKSSQMANYWIIMKYFGN